MKRGSWGLAHAERLRILEHVGEEAVISVDVAQQRRDVVAYEVGQVATHMHHWAFRRRWHRHEELAEESRRRFALVGREVEPQVPEPEQVVLESEQRLARGQLHRTDLVQDRRLPLHS